MVSKSLFAALFVTLIAVARGQNATTVTVCACTCSDGGGDSATTAAESTCDKTFQTGYEEEAQCQEECANQCPDAANLVASLSCNERSQDDMAGPGADPFHDFEGDATPHEPGAGAEFDAGPGVDDGGTSSTASNGSTDSGAAAFGRPTGPAIAAAAALVAALSLWGL